VPEFEFSPQFQLKISDLVTKGLRVETTIELRRLSGCDLKTAKAWVIHKTFEVLFTRLPALRQTLENSEGQAMPFLQARLALAVASTSPVSALGMCHCETVDSSVFCT
jgi:hypothetical protein